MSPFQWFLLLAFVGVYGALVLLKMAYSGLLGNAVWQVAWIGHSRAKEKEGGQARLDRGDKPC